MADSAHRQNLNDRPPTLREVARFKAQYMVQVQELAKMIKGLDSDYKTLRTDVGEYRKLLDLIPPPSNYNPALAPNTAYAWCIDYIANRVYGTWYSTLLNPMRASIQDIHKSVLDLAAKQYDPQYRESLIEELKKTGKVPAEQMQIIQIDAAKLEADFESLKNKAQEITEAMGEQIERCFPEKRIQ